MCEGRSSEGRESCIAMCNVLNSIVEHDPKLAATMMGSLLVTNGAVPEIEYMNLDGHMLTSMVGVINGGLREVGYRCNPVRIGTAIQFIPEAVNESQDSN